MAWHGMTIGGRVLESVERCLSATQSGSYYHRTGKLQKLRNLLEVYNYLITAWLEDIKFIILNPMELFEH